MKPASFPYLAIAKRFAVPYGTVLIYADICRGSDIDKRIAAQAAMSRRLGTDYQMFAEAVRTAIMTFIFIQEGRIDWMTGERLRP